MMNISTQSKFYTSFDFSISLFVEFERRWVNNRAESLSTLS